MTATVDETLEVGSSSQPTTEATERQTSAAKSQDAKAGDESSESHDDKQPESVSEALEKVVLEQPAEETAGAKTEKSGEDEKSEEASPAEEAEAGEDKPEGDEADKDGKAKSEGESDSSLDVQFDKRPEWTEAVKIGGDKIKPILRKVLLSETRAHAQVKQLKPLADVTNELRSIAGGEQEFTTMRSIIRAYGAGDPAVEPILEQMLTQIRTVNGKVLTSPDLVERQTALKKKFDAGLMEKPEFDEQVGLLKEAEQARAGRKVAESKLTQSDKQRQEQVQQQAAHAMMTAVNSWETNIRERDPDFGQVTDVNDAKHGESVADQVFDAICLKRMNKPEATTEELIAEANRTYKLARGRLAAPAQRQQRVITSQGSSVTAKPKPKTFREAMDRVKLEMP